ncbi:MAG: hypothetical protein EOM80_04235 [Erysipelotrichia bacterium]|nr:hypothetical protein [Erysipelotrichia bacterium]
MNRRTAIYIVYLIILFAAAGWRLARASSELPRIEDFIIDEREGETDVRLRLSMLKKPSVRYEGRDQCLILEFSGADIAPMLAKKAFAGRDLKLGYMVGADTDHRSRVRLFIRPECLATIRYVENTVVVRLAEKSGFADAFAADEKKLLDPREEKYAPAVLSLHESPFEPAVLELASKAGVKLEFAGNIPEFFSAELEAPTPLDALKAIAAAHNLEFYRRGPVWYMGRKNLTDEQS